MTPEQIDECMALFDRVNPDHGEPITHRYDENWLATKSRISRRIEFAKLLGKGPGIALGAVIDACLPEGMVYSVATYEPGPYAWVGKPGGCEPAHMADHPALAMCRAIRAAMDAEG